MTVSYHWPMFCLAVSKRVSTAAVAVLFLVATTVLSLAFAWHAVRAAEDLRQEQQLTRAQRDVAQRLRRAPMCPEPGERVGMVRAKPENVCRDRDERVQVERTGGAAPDPSDGQRVPARQRVAQAS